MARNFKERTCIICGSKFSPTAANQMCCCQKCSKINAKNVARQYRRNNPARFQKQQARKVKRKHMSELATINEKAREAGKSYGMYVMQETLSQGKE